MKKHVLRVLVAAGLLFAPVGVMAYGDYPIQGVSFNDVHFADIFWYPRLVQNQTATIPIALDQCYSTGRVDNFVKAAHILNGDASMGYFSTEYTFDDTDIYKILEGMSYSYKMMPSLSIKSKMDTLVRIVAAAQEPDGYITTARTAGRPGYLHSWLGARRWEKDPDLSHELYNSGHLFEAAAAHYQATGDTMLLRVAKKNADLLVDKFLKGGLAYEPGHQIVEMGLVKMYRVTGKEDYLKLAKYFLDIRGVKGPGSKHYEYNQSQMPPKDQRTAVGHAVRATYMYSGMADVSAIMHATAYQTAIDSIWSNVVGKKYYITGGIGAVHDGEKFGADYYLPNLTAYNETCAAIANVYWNWRMFLTYGDSKYYDVIERTLYNGVLSGISLSGDHFFYPNPLESTGGYSRSEWFGCACCPSNLCRFVPSIPGYAYAHCGDSVYVNLFVQGDATIRLDNESPMSLSQATRYPWEGAIKLTVNETPKRKVAMKIRIPGWLGNHPVPSNLYAYLDKKDAQAPVLKLNGKTIDYAVEKGYMTVLRQWRAGDELSFEFPMSVRRVVASDKVTDDRGCVALERGPIVYCLEWPDNDGEVLSAVVPDTASVIAREDSVIFKNFPHHDMMVLDINGGVKSYDTNGLVTMLPKRLTAIPYYAWANRGMGEMEVWMGRTAERAQTSTRTISHTDTLQVNVGEVPSAMSTDMGYPSVPVKVDIAAVAKSFGISTGKVRSLYGSKITYAAIEPNGHVNTQSTAGAPGHWFAADGSVTRWDNTGKVSVIFSEFNINSFCFNIGQYPGVWRQGDRYTICQALTYAPDHAAPRRVVFKFIVDATDAKETYEREMGVAKSLLKNEAYGNVKGDALRHLKEVVDKENTGNYLIDVQTLYAAVSDFVDAKVSFDGYDEAKLQSVNASSCYPYATQGKLSTLKKWTEISPISAAQADTLANRIREALKVVILSNADAEKTGETNMIVNPDFAQNNGSTADGWEFTTFIAGFMTIVSAASWDESSKPFFVNYGSWGQNTSSFDLKLAQTVQHVEPGQYLVSLMCRGKDLDAFRLTVGSDTADSIFALPFSGNTGELFGFGWRNVNFLVTVGMTSDVTLTVTASASKDQTFCSLGRFRMVRVPSGVSGIRNLQSRAVPTTAAGCYNLAGMTMLPYAQGIYVEKGRKFIKR